MKTIGESAKYVRSKNAGPFWLTIDIFCDTLEKYHEFANSERLTTANIAVVYGVKVDQVKLFFLEDLRIIKISFPRNVVQGDRYERDMHGGQQYISLLDFEI